jgi:hypothetical protein
MLLVKDSTTVGADFFTKSQDVYEFDDDQFEALQAWQVTISEYMESMAQLEKFKENSAGDITVRRMDMYHNKRCEIFYESQHVMRFLKEHGRY